jgi:CDP-diacylglycerol--glycerol-3-phosphate 3-phosphatidyltransferase
MAAMALATLVSYERARAESLGYTAKGGLMERAERTIALIAALAFHVLLIPVLWVLTVLTAFTAVQRFVMVWRQAPKPARAARPRMRAARRERVVSADRITWAERAERWRAWREQMAGEGRPRYGTRRERVARRRPTPRP